jgi:DNA-binding NtrC family response regulator
MVNCRLNVFPVRLPPLRERPGDIPLLLHFLVNKFALRVAKRLEGVSQGTMQRLQEYPSPGNVRELENVLERAVILTTGSPLDVAPDLLPAPAKTLPTEEGAEAADAGEASVPAPGRQARGQPLPCLEAVERDYTDEGIAFAHRPAPQAADLGVHLQATPARSLDTSNIFSPGFLGAVVA